MSIKVNAREVLLYLNELGYRNISADQLQEFIRDLKKLIKYDTRKTDDIQVIKVNILQDSTDDTSIYRPSVLKKCEKPKARINTSHKNVLPASSSQLFSKGDENLILSTPHICSSSAKAMKPSIDKQTSQEMTQSLEFASNSTFACPVHLSRKADGITKTDAVCTCHIDSSQITSSNGKVNYDKKDFGTIIPSDTNIFDDKRNTSKRFTSKKKSRKQSGTSKCEHDFTHPCFYPEYLRPRTAVIKCNTRSNPEYKKCDPVNLYKYYERQWKINKIPGENREREQKFRWYCREKISCGPPVSLRKPLKKKFDIVLPSVWL